MRRVLRGLESDESEQHPAFSYSYHEALLPVKIADICVSKIKISIVWRLFDNLYSFPCAKSFCPTRKTVKAKSSFVSMCLIVFGISLSSSFTQWRPKG